MRKIAIGIAAAVAVAAAVPASAQGIWIGVPGFGVGVGVGPTYAYGNDPYYGGYWGGRPYGQAYAYESYPYEPGYEYDSYAYLPDAGYAAYSYEPGVTYGYRTNENYRYAPRTRYTHNYTPAVRNTRGYAYGDTREVIRRSPTSSRAVVHHTEVRDGARKGNISAVGTERESATSRRMRSDEASKAMARQDSRQSKALESGKSGTNRARTQY
jgi:hypothetical protein